MTALASSPIMYGTYYRGDDGTLWRSGATCWNDPAAAIVWQFTAPEPNSMYDWEIAPTLTADAVTAHVNILPGRCWETPGPPADPLNQQHFLADARSIGRKV